MKYKIGLVIGKFLPPHKGHQYLFNFAQQYCEKLIIVVDSIEGQSISPSIRRDWIASTIPNAQVIALNHHMPQDPSETEDFWAIWHDVLTQCVGGRPDVLVAAMDYGWKLSEVLGCDFIQCDIARESIPISATEIRNNPMEHWKYIMDSAKPYFMKKLCLIGPESTGKTTCIHKLAHHYDTVFVPEYAKAIINSQNGKFFYDNVEQVAIAQIRSEKSLEHMVNKFMLCDSDVITTMVWSDILFGKHPPLLDNIAKSQKYDVTCVFDPSTPWVADTHRQLLQSPQSDIVRLDFFNRLINKLELFDRPYSIIHGDYNQKYDIVNNIITKHILDTKLTKPLLKI